MKYFLEVLQKKTEKIMGKDIIGYEIISNTEYPTKDKAKTALAKKEINSNQQKRVHLCTHNDTNPKPCEII